MFPHFNLQPAAEAFLASLGYVETALHLWTGPEGQIAALEPFCGPVVRVTERKAQ